MDAFRFPMKSSTLSQDTATLRVGSNYFKDKKIFNNFLAEKKSGFFT